MAAPSGPSSTAARHKAVSAKLRRTTGSFFSAGPRRSPGSRSGRRLEAARASAGSPPRGADPPSPGYLVMSVIVDFKLRANERPLALKAPVRGVSVRVRPVLADALHKQGLWADAGLFLDVRDRLVIRCQGDRARHRLAGRIGYRDLDGTRLTEPIHRLRGRDAHVEQVSHGRHEDLANFCMRLALADNGRFHKKVRHVARLDADGNDRDMVGNIPEPMAEQLSVASVIAPEDARIRLTDMNQQVRRVPNLIGGSIRNDLEVRMAELCRFERRPMNPEEGACGSGLTLKILTHELDPILSLGELRQIESNAAIRGGLCFQLVDRLQTNPLEVGPFIANARQPHAAVGRHARAIGRLQSRQSLGAAPRGDTSRGRVPALPADPGAPPPGCPCRGSCAG